MCLTKKDIIVDHAPCLIIFLVIAKLYLWDCRRNQTLPNVRAFRSKVQLKYETEIYIARTSNNMKFLREKWATFFILNRRNNLFF